MTTINDKINDAAVRTSAKDTYLEGLYNTLELCDIVLQNSQVLPEEHVLKAQKLRRETMENIRKREAIPAERRL